MTQQVATTNQLHLRYNKIFVSYFNKALLIKISKQDPYGLGIERDLSILVDFVVLPLFVNLPTGT